MKKKNNPFNIVKMFEDAMCDYTGAKYAVALDSCTNALFLCCKWQKKQTAHLEVTIPQRTYLSVPQSIMRAGYRVNFKDYEWKGVYQLDPLPVYDAAKRLTSNMYIEKSFMCLSFHIKKHLSIGKGGMILCDDKEAYEWFKKMRYEGRSEVKYHDDDIELMGYNMYMSPIDAARGLMLLQNYPEDMDDLIEDPPYRDLKEFKLFEKNEVVK